MCVELRRRVAVYGPRAVVFEQGRNRISGGLRAPIAAEPRLHVRLQLLERHPDALAVGLTHSVIAANEGRNRHALWCGECRVPPGAMLHRRHVLAVRVFGLTSGLMADELFAGHWMLAFSEPLELVFAHLADEAPPLRKLSVPDAANHRAFGVVVLARVLKFFLVVPPRLARAQGLGHREHERRLLKEWLLRDRRGG